MENKGSFKKGFIPWNKGLLGWRRGEKHPWMPKGELHWSWKGNKIKYRALHMWVVKMRNQWNVRSAELKLSATKYIGRIKTESIKEILIIG